MPISLQREWSRVRALALLGIVAPAPIHGAGLTDRIAYTLTNRLRYEDVEWFGPPNAAASPNARRYGFWGNQLRAGVTLTYPRLQLVLEAQDTRLWRLPDDATLPPPYGSLGPGAIYFAHQPGDTDAGASFLKQGFLALRGSGFSGSLGRFQLADGLETVPGDASLVWLKRARIAERLIGPFGWTHVTRSFDGARAAFDRPAWNLTAFAGRPTFGGYEVEAGHRIEDLGLAGLAWTRKQTADGPRREARLFVVAYEDERRVDKVDNRPTALRAADRGSLRLRTWGGHALGLAGTTAGTVDLLFWGAWQEGTWGTLDHRAWAAALEGGFQFRGGRWAPWLRAGYDLSSGDDDPDDRRHETFFQILPTARIYAQFPFYNLMNSRDLFAQAIFQPAPGWTLRMDVHRLRLSAARDLWYAGGGATNDRFFGFSGLPTGGAHDLADLFDVGISARLHKRISAYAYVGRARGHAVVRETFARPDATYGYLELVFRY